MCKTFAVSFFPLLVLSSFLDTFSSLYSFLILSSPLVLLSLFSRIPAFLFSSLVFSLLFLFHCSLVTSVFLVLSSLHFSCPVVTSPLSLFSRHSSSSTSCFLVTFLLAFFSRHPCFLVLPSLPLFPSSLVKPHPLSLCYRPPLDSFLVVIVFLTFSFLSFPLIHLSHLFPILSWYFVCWLHARRGSWLGHCAKYLMTICIVLDKSFIVTRLGFAMTKCQCNTENFEPGKWKSHLKTL